MNQDSDSRDQPTGQDPLLLLKTLQLLWTKKEMKQLKEEIRRGFAGLEDPLAGLLDMLESSSDWKGKGHSLGYYITTELQLWIKEHPAVPQSGIKLKKLQARVLRILAQCPANLLDPLISIYQLHTADRNYLLGHVSHLYHKGDYKELNLLLKDSFNGMLPARFTPVQNRGSQPVGHGPLCHLLPNTMSSGAASAMGVCLLKWLGRSLSVAGK